MKEIEVKAHLRDEQTVISALNKLGIELSPSTIQKDRVFFPKGLAPGGRPAAPALRIRDQDGKYIFTYKLPQANQLDKIEHESEISNPEAIAAMCEQLGFVEIIKLNKVRRKAHYNNYEICLDEVEGLGSYIEVEKMSEEDALAVQEELFNFLKTLGIDSADRVYKGYDLLMFDKIKLQNSIF